MDSSHNISLIAYIFMDLFLPKIRLPTITFLSAHVSKPLWTTAVNGQAFLKRLLFLLMKCKSLRHRKIMDLPEKNDNSSHKHQNLQQQLLLRHLLQIELESQHPLSEVQLATVPSNWPLLLIILPTLHSFHLLLPLIL